MVHGNPSSFTEMTTTELLLASIDEAYDKRSWHGTNLRGSLRGVTREQAAWRIRPGSHNISKSRNTRICKPGWRNWQTHRT